MADHSFRRHDNRRTLQTLGGAMLVYDNQGPCGEEEDKSNVRPHSAAFSVQSVGGRTETVLSGEGVHPASSPGDQASAAMLTQS